MQHVNINDDQNRSLTKIFVVEYTNVKIEIYDINEINLNVLEEQKVVLSRDHFILFRDHRIIDIQNVASEFDCFLTILLVERRILKTHVDD